MKRKNSRSSGARRKQHQRACAKPQTQKLLKQLQTAWPTLNLVERGHQLKKLLGLECTARGLAADLDVDERIVRRNVSISELSQEARAAIAAGCDPEPYLRSAANQAIETATWGRAAVEPIDGSPSEALAYNIVWLLVHEGRGMQPKYLLFILDEAERATYERTATLRRIGTPEPPAPVSQRLSFVQLAGLCRYQTSEDILFDARVIEQLAKAVLCWEPARFIRDAAFKKATLLLENCKAQDADPKLADELGPAVYGELLVSHQAAKPVWRRAT